MPISEETASLLQALAASEGPAFVEMSPDEARAAYVEMAAMQGEPEEVASVADRAVPGPVGAVPIRVYRPDLNATLPVFIYYHGGGWEVGDLDSHDPLCRQIANAAGCAVVAVDYRLAPENKYPAAAEDAYAVAAWLAKEGATLGLDGDRIAVGGDSAGGNLAAVVPLMARARQGPTIAAQILVYPITNHRFDTPSYREHGQGFILAAELMQQFWRCYLADETDGEQPYASPLRAPDLGGLPRALVMTAGFDVLRDEGEAYGERLRAAGVDTTIHRYDGMMHGFLQFGSVIPEAHDAVREIALELQSAFAPMHGA
jgi:acetyl esterase